MGSFAQSTTSIEDALITSISGYDGYQSPAVRKETDNRIRDYLASLLKKIQQELSRLESKMKLHKSHGYLETIQHLASILKTIIHSMRNPSYNKSGFFQKQKLNPDVVNQLYDFDSRLVDQVDIALDDLEVLSETDDDAEIGNILRHLFDLVDGVSQYMSEREFLILGE